MGFPNFGPRISIDILSGAPDLDIGEKFRRQLSKGSLAGVEVELVPEED